VEVRGLAAVVGSSRCDDRTPQRGVPIRDKRIIRKENLNRAESFAHLAKTGCDLFRVRDIRRNRERF
jgi:hypothetical protein